MIDSSGGVDVHSAVDQTALMEDAVELRKEVPVEAGRQVQVLACEMVDQDIGHEEEVRDIGQEDQAGTVLGGQDGAAPDDRDDREDTVLNFQERTVLEDQGGIPNCRGRTDPEDQEEIVPEDLLEGIVQESRDEIVLVEAKIALLGHGDLVVVRAVLGS